MTIKQAINITGIMLIGLIIMLTIGCGVIHEKRGPAGSSGSDGNSCSIVGPKLVCPDGSEFDLPVDRVDPDETPMVLTTKILIKNSCNKVRDGVYIENIKKGEIFDVYSNDTCSDSRGEYCDNVATSYGSSGHLGNTSPGSSTVCWVDNVQFSGVKQNNGDILLYILEFTKE